MRLEIWARCWEVAPLSHPAVTVSLGEAVWNQITPLMNIINSIFTIILCVCRVGLYEDGKAVWTQTQSCCLHPLGAPTHFPLPALSAPAKDIAESDIMKLKVSWQIYVLWALKTLTSYCLVLAAVESRYLLQYQKILWQQWNNNVNENSVLMHGFHYQINYFSLQVTFSLWIH